MKLTRLTATVIAAATVIMPFSSSTPVLHVTSSVLSGDAAFDEESFFVYVGTYSGGIAQFRYLYPESDDSYNADKVLWKDAPSNIAYGDVFVAEGKATMTQVYPAKADPINAHAYYYTLDEGSELEKAGNCSDIMDKKDLKVTSKTYDGSAHWSVRYADAAGETYYYGLSTYGSNLIVDPLDCEVGDVYTYALYNDYMVVPLEKKDETSGVTMKVEIVEIKGNTLFLKRTDCPDSDEQLTMSTQYLEKDVVPKVGMKLEVAYSGLLQATDPLRFEKITKVTVIPDETELLPGQVRITLVDADTNEPIIYRNDNDSKFGFILFRECNLGDGKVENPAVTVLNTNPSIIKYEDLSEEREYTFHLEKNSTITNYSVLQDESSVVRNENNSYDLVFKVKYTPSGDVNNDGKLTVSDVVLFQRWLLNIYDSKLLDWKAADYCNDNKLDFFDLCIMKRELLKNTVLEYVEPDERYDFGVTATVAIDGLELHRGPDDSYETLDSIPANVHIVEYGSQIGNSIWMFTEYDGKYGWIRTMDDEGKTPYVHYEMMAKKPVIYLYPEQETDVHIDLELTESEFYTSYPKYDNGWDVVAYPDGKILNKADGSYHRYLFWEADNCRTKFDFSKGFCVSGSDTESFLKEKLTYMGLTKEEMNEFIVYWLPEMEHNAYNLIAFQGDAYTNSAKLTVTPAPDSECRIFMAFVPLEDDVDIEPQQLETFERKGFTVVEWGGAEVR